QPPPPQPRGPRYGDYPAPWQQAYTRAALVDPRVWRRCCLSRFPNGCHPFPQAQVRVVGVLPQFPPLNTMMDIPTATPQTRPERAHLPSLCRQWLKLCPQISDMVIICLIPLALLTSLSKLRPAASAVESPDADAADNP